MDMQRLFEILRDADRNDVEYDIYLDKLETAIEDTQGLLKESLVALRAAEVLIGEMQERSEKSSYLLSGYDNNSLKDYAVWNHPTSILMDRAIRKLEGK